MRYDEAERCRFCAIEASLEAGSTIAVKTPAQLAEVAEAAARLDGIRQMVMTTGTSKGRDRGATHLARCVRAVLEAVPGLPIQVQCEPPSDVSALQALKDAGAVSIGIHVESMDDEVRRRWTPARRASPSTSTAGRGARRCGSSAATRCRPTSSWASERTRTSWSRVRRS